MPTIRKPLIAKANPRVRKNQNNWRAIAMAKASKKVSNGAYPVPSDTKNGAMKTKMPKGKAIKSKIKKSK